MRFLSDTKTEQLDNSSTSFPSRLWPSAGLRPPAERTPTSRAVRPCHCSCLHTTIPGKLRVTLLCFSGTNCTPSLADGRAAGWAAGCSLSPSESPASSWASARVPEVAPPAGSERLRSVLRPSLPRRSTTPGAFPLQLRLSLPRSHGRAAGAPGHAAGRAGAGLRAAAGAGAAAGGRPLPGVGRGRQERALPGPVRGAESDRAVRAELFVLHLQGVRRRSGKSPQGIFTRIKCEAYSYWTVIISSHQAFLQFNRIYT
ncbi:peroxiredoxin-like 2C isoform 1-T1 [Passerculus sandwichensis]